MIRHRPTGWNTWDFRGFNRLVYLDRGHTAIIVQYAIWDEDYRPEDQVKNRGGLRRDFRWSDAIRLGKHAPLGLPAALDFQAGNATFRAEAVEQAGRLDLKIEPLDETRQRIVFAFLAPAGETQTIVDRHSGIFAGFNLSLENATWPRDYFLNVPEPYAIGLPGQAATLHIEPPTELLPDKTSPTAQPAASLRGEGALANAPEAMVRAVTWNTLFDTRRRLVSSPVSRDWCVDWKGVSVWCWDTYLLGAMISYASPPLGRYNFESVSAAIDELGMVPNYFMAHGAASRDRSMPPIGSYLIWKTQRLSPDVDWLREIYPRLQTWHKYWFEHRDGNGDGLLEWGSDATPKFEFPQLLQDNPQLQHSAKCAMYESGLDNSPMYDDVPFNEQTNTLELADVGLNSYYAMDCESLSAIAGCLGEADDAAEYRREYDRIRQLINDQLWDEQHGIYCNRHWNGGLSKRWATTSFFPLIAGVAPRERAERMIHEHLLNPDEFWGDWVIPSISRNDPAYPDNDYWRGRIWGPFNYLTAEGLRRYRFDSAAAELARKSVELFMTNWRADGGVYENYNADTGAGADVWNAARLYHWGGLLTCIAIEELIDVEPLGYLRLGSLEFPDAAIRNAHVGGHLFDVELGRGLRVTRDGQPFLECDQRAIVRIPLTGDEQPIEYSAATAARLVVHDSDFSSRPLKRLDP